MKMNLRKIIALVLTVALIGTTVTFTAGNTLKASDGDGTYTAEEQKAPAPEPEKAEAPAPAENPVSDTQEISLGSDSSDSGEAAKTDSSAVNDDEQADEGNTDENKTEEEKTDQDKDDQVKMPAQNFSGSGGGLSVNVSAPEGALPEGTTMTVTGISESSAKSIAQSGFGDKAKVKDAKGVDITFHYKGKKIEPEKSVKVTFSGADLEGKNATVFHHDGSGTDKVGRVSNNGGTVSASEFSEYVVATEETYTVTFLMTDDEGKILDQIDQVVYQGEGTITLPDIPFKGGYRFDRWADAATGGNEVTEGMAVTKNMNVYAQFKEIKIYEINVEYWYKNKKTGDKVVFSSKQKQAEKADAPIKFYSPDSVNVNQSGVTDPDYPVYYPSTQTIVITEADFDEVTTVDSEGIGHINKSVEYKPYDTTYYVDHMLKDLSGDGYTKVDESTEYGVKGSVVTPQEKNIPGAEFEKSESEELTEAGQRLEVYYTRSDETLSFVTGDGSYVEKIHAPYQTVVNLNDVEKPTRAGYTFAGWFKDEQCTVAAGNSVTLTEDTVLYAKWNASTVNYTILYQIENANDDGYSFLASSTAQAVAGSVVSLTKAQADSKAPSALDKTNFTFKESDEKVIAPDGTTVISVKYSRNVYTAKWNGEVYNTSNRRIGQNEGTASITAKYGQTITAMWQEAFNKKYPQYAWNFTKNNNDKFVNIDTMPSGNKTVYAYEFSTDNEQTLNYWLEGYSGSQSKTRNGKTYGLYKSITVKFNYLYDSSEFYQIDGYTKDGYDAGYYNWRGKWTTYSLGNQTVDGLTANFYYAAKTYPLAFYNYDGSLISTENVKLNADISTRLSSAEKVASKPVSDAVFDAWYTDSDHQNKNTVTKMPTGLALYANWTIPDRTITFYNYSYTLGKYDAGTAKTVEYGGFADSYTPASPGDAYEFAGWYDKPQDDPDAIPYDFAKPITENTKVYAKYTQKPLSYTVRYENENGEELVAPKVVKNPNFKIDQEVTETAVTFSGMKPDQAVKTIKLGTGTNEIVFVYSAKPAAITYTVNYVLESDPTVSVAASKTKTVSGDVETVKEKAKAVDYSLLPAKYQGQKYYPTEDTKVHILGTGENVITFYYVPYKTAKFNIKYVDMDGNEIATGDNKAIRKGESINVVKDIAGWTYKYVEKDGTKTTHKNFVANDYETHEMVVYYQKDLTLTAKNLNKIYDGSALKSEGTGGTVLEVEGLQDGHKVASVEYDGSQTNVGTSPTTPKNAVISGPKSDAYYNIIYKSGTLTVNKASVTVTITGDKIDKVYDGNKYTAGYKVTVPEGSAFKEEYIQFNGADGTDSVSRTNVGKDDLTLEGLFTTKDAYKANFDVRYNVSNGYVNITPATIKVTTGSDSKAYDGTALTKAGVKIEGLVNGETATGTATGSQTEVGSSDNTYTIEWGTAQAGNYKIETDLGKLEVTANNTAITLTAPSDSKTYDGTALTKTSGVTATGLPAGFTVEATATGSQTDAGSSANVVNNGYIIRNGAGKDKTSNFTNITTVNGTLTVNPAPVTITTGSDSKAYDGTALTNDEAGITGLVNNETATVTATGSQTEVGSSDNTYEITWGSAKAGNYTVTENMGTLTVTESSVDVILTAPSDSKTYDGTALTKKNGVTASGLPTGFTVEATASGSQTDAGSSANVVDEGYVIKNAAGEDKTSSFKNIKTVDGTLTVNPAPVTITTGSDSKAYDGTALTKADASITGLVNNETATVTATGSQTEVGSSDNTYEITWGTAKAGNYKITENLGTLEVTENSTEITLTAASDSKTYDGTALTKTDGVTASGLPEGFTVEATASGSQTDAGHSANVVDKGYVIKNASGEDKTTSFTNVKTVNGTLTVNPAPITVTTGSDSKEYDGTALTKDDAEITGLVNDETATVKATGSQTEVGSSDNTYEITWGTAKSGNYTITEKIGTLEVTENATEITLTAPSDKKVYDGTALTKKNGVTATGLPAGFTVEATASGSQTNVGKADNVVDNGYVIKNAAGEDKTSSFTNITKAKGTLEVTPASITVKTGSASKTYDGTALTKAEASIEGLVNGETAAVTATGSQTEVGSSSNTYSIEWGTAQKGNYTITEKLGSLEVTENASAVTLTAPTDSKTYDGTALTKNTGVTATGLPAGFTVVATASGSQTDAGSSANVVDEGYVIKNAAGEDKTSSFTNVTTVDGTLTVNPAPVTITTGSDSKAYDGTALTKDEASIEGLVNNETATVTATGSQTEVGSSDNTFEITWGTAKSGNYTVTENLGTLTVTEESADVVLTAPSETKTYDGTALTKKTGVTATGLPKGFTVEATAKGSQTDAGSSANVVNDGYVIKNAAGEDKTKNFTNIKTVDGSLTVNPAPVTVKTGSDSKAYDGTALTKDEASIEGLVNNETATVKATGSQKEVGSSDNTYSIEWGTAKKGNYTITENLGTLTVTENSTEITLTAPSDSKTYDGTVLTKKSGVTATGLPEGFTVEATAKGSQTDAGSSANIVNDGYVIKNAAGEDKTKNFTNIKTVDGNLTVDPAPITVKTGSDSKAYDGTALTKDEASIEGLVNDETATVKATGSQTEVGSSDNTYEITWGTAKSGNYTITEKLGTLEVTTSGAEVKLTAGSDSKTYDGTALTKNDVTASGLPEGFTVEATASGSQTKAGSSANTVNDGYVIKNAEGEDKTDNFTNVQKVPGTLTVDPAPLKVTTGSDSKKYDGKALTDDEANLEGLVNSETASVLATGSQTDVGSSSNTYKITWGTADKGNYTITEDLGMLTVTSSDDEITLIAPSDSKTYDGKALTKTEGVTATGLPEGFTVEATASGSQTDVGSSDNVVDDGYVIRNEAGEDKTSSFTKIGKSKGTLTVNPAELTVTTESDTKAYDGTALTKSGVKIEGFVNGETAEGTATGSQTEVGSSDNTYTIDWDDVNASNYSITEHLGTLTVTKNSTEITLTAPSDKKVYDGAALTKTDGVTASGLPEGFTVEATASGSQTNVGKADNVVDNGYVIKNAEGEDKTSSFTNITKAKGTLEVTPAPITVKTGSASKAYDGTALTKDEASIEGLVNGEEATATATGKQTEVGSSDNTYTIAWGTVDKNNYEITEDLGTLEVTANDVEVTLTAPSGSKTYDGTPLTKTSGVTAEGLPEGFTVQATASGSQTDAGSSDNVVDDGYIILDTAGANKTANFTNVSKAPGTLTVNPKKVTVTTGSAGKEYDGTALKNSEADISGIVTGETVTVKATGSQTDIGSSDNTYEITWGTAKASNYTLNEELGTLEVTASTASVVLTAPSDSKTYDGTPLTKSEGVTASGLPEGFTVEATAAGSQTDAGEGTNIVNEGYIIKNAAGENKTSSFTNVTKESGTLTVNPAPVTVTTGSASKKYDGSPLTKDEASITGLVNSETATVTATGTQTEIGSSDNTYTISWGTAKAGNYTITDALGTLTVTSSDVDVVLTAPSDNKVYDGTALTKTNGVTASGLPDGFTVEATASGSQTDVGEGANVVNDGYVIRNAAGEDKTSNFTKVEKVDGKLTVTPATLTITTPSETKVYDGTALTKKGKIEGLVNGEEVTFETTGSQTEVGESDNTYELEFNKTAKAENYTIVKNVGKLKVTEYTGEITVTTTGGIWTYDGQAHGATVQVSELPTGYTLETAASTATATDYTSEPVVAAADQLVIRNAEGKDVTKLLNIVQKTGTIVINKAPLTVVTNSDSKVYDGDPLTADGELTGLKNGETASFKTTGTITDPGEADNTYELKFDGTADENNYYIDSESIGKLTVTADETEVVVNVSKESKNYDGKPLKAEVTVSGLDTSKYTVQTAKSNASATDVTNGEVTASCDELVIINNATGKDVTAKLNITKNTGSIEITPATLTVTTPSTSKVYDGQPLTAAGSYEGLQNGETIGFVTTGSQTVVGNSDNTYELTWAGLLNEYTAKSGNYTVKDSIGTLTVSEYAGEITVTTTGGTWTYDGQAHGATVEVSQLPAGYHLEVAASTASATNATKESVSATADQLIIRNAEGEDVTGKLNIKKVDGSIIINPAPLTVTTEGASKVYDGEALTNPNGNVTGLVNNETATIVPNGTITDPGTVDNTYTIGWGNTNSDNYTIDSEHLGKLTVTESADEIVVTTTGGTWVYDGKAHGATVEVSQLPKGYTLDTAESSASATDVTKSPVKATADTLIIRNAAGKDVTANLNITYVNGKITVNPVKITVVTNGASKQYDSKALKSGGTATVENGGTFTYTSGDAITVELVNGETASFRTTGSQTKVGKSANTYELKFGSDETADPMGIAEVGEEAAASKASNYTVEETIGTLRVAAAPAPGPGPAPAPGPGPGVGPGNTAAVPGMNGMTLTQLQDGQTPLSNNILDWFCCYLHVIILLLALITLLLYTKDMKKRQRRILDLEEELEEDNLQ